MIHEENGQIIVDELRPMSEAPNNKVFLVWHKESPKYALEAFNNNGVYEVGGINIKAEELLGWMKMPIYRPKDGV